MRTAKPKLQLKDTLVGDKVILKDDPRQRVFVVKESQYPSYFDLWIDDRRVITASPSEEVELAPVQED